MTELLLIKYGEIALRGKNRPLYENMLISAIRKTSEKAGTYFVKKEQGRFLVEPVYGEPIDYDALVPLLQNVFGVVAICPAVKSEDQSLDALKTMALAHMQAQYGDKPMTFKVETKRAVKKYPLVSHEVSASIGEYLLDNMPNLTVNVREPDVVLFVELRSDAYMFSRIIRGPGGLPFGSAGKAVLLLSGGLDSPVAGYYAAKRGLEVQAVYFHSPPYTSERAKEKVLDLAAQLSMFTGKVELFVVPFTDVQLHIAENAPPEKTTILLKRAMLHIASRIAKETGALALVTGDSIGQVASQTLHSLAAVNSAATLPIIRPLACMDKIEIINVAERIGTYDISIRPFDDCCTLFLPEHPETKPKASIIEAVEKKMPRLDELMDIATQQKERVIL